jgi:hypothetical protein
LYFQYPLASATAAQGPTFNFNFSLIGQHFSNWKLGPLSTNRLGGSIGSKAQGHEDKQRHPPTGKSLCERNIK